MILHKDYKLGAVEFDRRIKPVSDGHLIPAKPQPSHSGTSRRQKMGDHAKDKLCLKKGLSDKETGQKVNKNDNL